MATVNGQFFNLGGGNVPQWNPVEKPNLIQAGKDTSPSVFIVNVDMTFTVDDVVQAKRDTAIYFNQNTQRWRVIGGVSEKERGWFTTLSALQSAVPNPSIGDYAYVNATGTFYLYSSTGWLNSGKTTPPNALTTADIEDSLASQSPSSVLSANQGYILDQEKVDKITGYSLSKNDFTDVLKTKLDGIQTGAEVNVQANWTETNSASDAYIANIPRNELNLPDYYTTSQVYTKTEANSAFVENSEKAQPLGVATLDASGKVPLAQLNATGVKYYPAYANFPVTGSIDNIYLAIDSNIIYSWVVAANQYKEIGDASLLKTSDVVDVFNNTATNKPASANTVKILYDTKVDKVTGKQLSTEDYTSTEKTKLASIQTGAEVNVKANWAETNSTLDSFIEDKPIVVNNLASTSAIDVLSANQGNALDLKKIEKVPNFTDFLPKFNLDGSLVSSTKKTSDFEPANPDILKTTDIIDNLSGGDVGNTRQVLEASQGKILKDQIDTKEPIITSGLSTQYWRGDKTWQALNQNAVGISNRFITNLGQEIIASSLATPDDISDQNNVRIRVANTTVASTKGADFELQAGNGTDGSGDVVFYGAATPENAITVGANAGSSGSSATALSFSQTVTSVSDRLLIVQVVCTGGQQSSSVTFASVPLTLAERTQSTIATIETWYLVNPQVGTSIVQVNFATSVGNVVARAINLNGVNQTNPIGQKTEVFNNSLTTSASLSVSTTLGQIVVDLIGTFNSTATAGVDQIQIWSGSTPQSEKGQGSYEIAQTPTTTLTYTFTDSAYAFHIIAINRVGSADLSTISEFGRFTSSGVKTNGLILPSSAYSVGGTYILTQQSTTKHRITNSGTYNFNLPKATYLRVGMIYEFTNKGSGSVSIRTQDAVQIATCPPNYTVILELTNNSIGYNGTWEASHLASNGSVVAYVTSQKGIANGIAPLNASSIIDSQYLPAVAGGASVADVKLSARTSDHNGWLLCDGRLISRTTYSALFAIVGTSFGVGDGTTTFTLPAPAGRSLGVAGSGSGLTTRAIGASVGSETHILAISEMPAHTHDLQGYNNVQVGTDRQVRARNTISGDPLDTDRALSRGGSGAHNNMQPTLFIGNSFIYAGV